MGRPAPGQLERSLAAMTIAPHRELAKRRKALLDTKTGEYLQQLRIPLSGSALPTWVYADLEVQWEMPFLYAPLQRRVPFTTPHFSYGVEFTYGTTDLVVIDAHVVGWDVTDEGWYTGATVRFAASAPNVTDVLEYDAIVHLSFQGFSAMSETGEFG